MKSQEKFITSFDGAKIFYEQFPGDGRGAIFFLPGLGGNASGWSPSMEYFNRRGFTTLGIDFRGQGNSERGANERFYAIANLVRDVATVTKKEGLERPVIVGHSFGGMVGLEFCAQFPDSASGLVLVGASYRVPLKNNLARRVVLSPVVDSLARLFAVDGQKKKRFDYSSRTRGESDILRWLIVDIQNTGVAGYLWTLRNILRYDGSGAVARLSTRTLLVAGKKDRVFPLEKIEPEATEFPNSRLSILEEADHMVLFTHRQDLHRTIEDFLGGQLGVY